MSLVVEPGHHLLRLVVRTPCNFGDGGGTAVVDRPVALDVWDDLPYLPASSLKGVLAGRAGNLHRADGSRNERREALFGSAEIPGRVVFGDGELLLFPVLLRDGSRADVVPARTLYRIVRAGGLELPGFRAAERPDAYMGEPDPWRLPAPAHRVDLGFDLGTLEQALGRERLVVAGPEAAAALWRQAVEERTLTALVSAERTVRDGSLRTVELIPRETVFVSWVTCKGPRANLGGSARLQVGAFEGIGCGFVEIDGRPLAGSEGPVDPPAPRPTGSRPRELPDHELMVFCFQAVRSAADQPWAAVIRSAIFDLGPRLKIQGLPRALAFCLAKAGGVEDPAARIGRERRAYRHLLGSWLFPGDTVPFERVRRRALALAEGREEPSALLDRGVVWLRRFAEIQLAETSSEKAPSEQEGEES